MGLPVIVQEDDNLSPIMRRYFSGTMIPQPTPRACAEAIIENDSRREELPAAGRRNREQFENQFTWAHVARWVSWVLTRDDSWIREFDSSYPCGRLEKFPPSFSEGEDAG